MKPSEDLDNEITTASLLHILNNESPFDFTYTPTERDTLHVSISTVKVRHKYFSLIFRGGKWAEGGNPVLTSRIQTLANGIIEISK
ncbi:MAG: hypothetical protein JNM88_20380 [Chitinophagaceae bacterium]|nr:hypothetical protein [Chitinophagaceae bacterium]